MVTFANRKIVAKILTYLSIGSVLSLSRTVVYGTPRTLSMMWISPLVAAIFAVTTVAFTPPPSTVTIWFPLGSWSTLKYSFFLSAAVGTYEETEEILEPSKYTRHAWTHRNIDIRVYITRASQKSDQSTSKFRVQLRDKCLILKKYKIRNIGTVKKYFYFFCEFASSERLVCQERE